MCKQNICSLPNELSRDLNWVVTRTKTLSFDFVSEEKQCENKKKYTDINLTAIQQLFLQVHIALFWL